MRRPKKHRDRCNAHGKIVYGGQMEAVMAAAAMARYQGKAWRAYQARHPQCHAWHITTQPHRPGG